MTAVERRTSPEFNENQHLTALLKCVLEGNIAIAEEMCSDFSADSSAAMQANELLATYFTDNGEFEKAHGYAEAILHEDGPKNLQLSPTTRRENALVGIINKIIAMDTPLNNNGDVARAIAALAVTRTQPRDTEWFDRLLVRIGTAARNNNNSPLASNVVRWLGKHGTAKELHAQAKANIHKGVALMDVTDTGIEARKIRDEGADLILGTVETIRGIQWGIGQEELALYGLGRIVDRTGMNLDGFTNGRTVYDNAVERSESINLRPSGYTDDIMARYTKVARPDMPG